MSFEVLLPGKTGPTIWALEGLLGLLPCNGSDKRHSSTRVGWSVQRWNDGLIWYGECRLSRRDQPQPVVVLVRGRDVFAAVRFCLSLISQA